MYRAVVLVLLSLFAFAFASVPQNKKSLRLIQFNETSQQWLTEDQIIQFAIHNVKFMDITDFPHLGDTHHTPLSAIPGQPAFPEVVNPLLQFLSINQIVEYLTFFSSFPNRRYDSAEGEAAVIWLEGEYKRHAGSRSDITVTRFQNTFRQDSVIARIEGEGPNADQVVIIGGHVDSIAGSGNAPGADDDGSGSMTVLEVFRALVLTDFKPKRSIEFHGYAGEEGGLRGSQAIASDYSNRGIDVFGMMQFDMTGYVRSGTVETIGIVTDFVDLQLTQFVRALVTAYTDLPFTNTQCGYACSDHASWTRAGYRSSFPFESVFSNLNPNIHTNRDLITHLSQSHMLEFSKLGLAFAVEMSLADE